MISKSLAVPYDPINDVTKLLTKGRRAPFHLLGVFAASGNSSRETICECEVLSVLTHKEYVRYYIVEHIISQ